MQAINPVKSELDMRKRRKRSAFGWTRDSDKRKHLLRARIVIRNKSMCICQINTGKHSMERISMNPLKSIKRISLDCDENRDRLKSTLKLFIMQVLIFFHVPL